MNRIEVMSTMRDFLEYGPEPADDGEAYDAADALLETDASTAELLDAMGDVLNTAREARTHHQHMLREAAEAMLRRARESER